MWYDSIYKLGIQVLDYGIEFSDTEKYEYNVLTFDKENKTDTIPGTFNNKQGITIHIRNLAKEITEKSGHICSIDKKIHLIAMKNSNSEKHKALDEKLIIKQQQKIMENNKHRRKVICDNRYPGGSRDHSER